MTSEHDRLIDALLKATNRVAQWRFQDTDYPTLHTLQEEKRAARQALMDYIEQRTLTHEEASAIIEDDLTDRPSRSPAATSAINKCVGIIEDYLARGA